VGLLWLAIPRDGVSDFLSALQNRAELKSWLPGDYHSWIGRLPGQPAFVASDAAGRFRLPGLGRDRLAELVVQGPGIADGTAMVLTRRMGRVVGPASSRLQPEPPPPLTVYGAAFDYVAPPSRPIVGVVRDQATGVPLAGVSVTSRRMPGKDMSGADPPGSITDAAGRYVLHGHPKAASYAAAAVPAPGAPYLVGHAEVADRPGTGPLQADIALARGIPFRVRPVDAVTGRPVVAEVSYYPLHPNPHVRGPVGFGAAGGGPLSRVKANPDGSYSGVALPGPGAICIENRQEIYLPVKINPRAFFKPGQLPNDPLDRVYGDESWLIVEQGEQGLWFFPHEQFQAIVLINPGEGSGPVEREAMLVPARKVEGTVLGPDGQPLPGAEVYQMDGYRAWTVPLPGATFMATKVDPDRPRKVFFRHVQRKLAGMLVVPTAGDEPPAVQLRPWATLAGRLIDAEGRPRPGLQLSTLFTPAMRADRNSGEFTEWIRTDPAGRFRIEGLVPGLRYSLNVMIESSISEGSNIFKDMILEPGETKDLGDVREESQRSVPVVGLPGQRAAR
jgi:hypothetical protein